MTNDKPGYPPLVTFATEDEYRAHFQKAYCSGVVATFDRMLVRFRKRDFDHAFYESSSRSTGTKDLFSRQRAERIDWIGAALRDPEAELYCGWDSKRRKEDKTRRVAVIQGHYVVVVQAKPACKGEFLTAYVADPQTIAQIRGHTPWQSHVPKRKKSR